jgi:hypothetical protein
MRVLVWKLLALIQLTFYQMVRELSLLDSKEHSINLQQYNIQPLSCVAATKSGVKWERNRARDRISDVLMEIKQ